MNKKKGVTQQRLKELFLYDDSEGVLRRLVRRKRSKWGIHAPVGHVNDNGYVMVAVDGANYRAHALIWLYCTGEWPSAEVDHIDRNRSNNRFSNLRLATRKQNAENASLSTRNTSGHRGVTWWARDRNWKAQIFHNGKNYNLGYFDDFQSAVNARMQAEKRLFTHSAAA
jgi:hypothetical protein